MTTIAEALKGKFLFDGGNTVSEIITVGNVFDCAGDDRTLIVARIQGKAEIVSIDIDQFIDGSVTVFDDLASAEAEKAKADAEANTEAAA